ncbi:hypothetical protein NPIL_419671 [Nephila pilipes]|uniref:Uncharacterized protein n=1 Tax=Nephila pilipes TaxID=299642 RepID=A0A8X6QFY3_NEPPI|nr:hypothetical protein NPIL_419671 [Nephila pilipes]
MKALTTIQDQIICSQNLDTILSDLAAMNEAIFSLEGKIQNIALFPHLYEPGMMYDTKKSIESYKIERSRLQSELNLNILCPIDGCLQHSHLSNPNFNYNINLNSTSVKKKRQLDANAGKSAFNSFTKTAKHPK